MKCVIKSCQTNVKESENETEMCTPHWRQVPGDLKREIWDCLKEITKVPGADARLGDLRQMARLYVERRDK